MKKRLISLSLILSLVFGLFGAAPLFADEHEFNAVENFDLEEIAEPFKYFASLDKGATFEEMDEAVEEEWGDYWYDAEKNIGLGINNDQDAYLELNVKDDNEAVAVLAFVAPEDGVYEIADLDIPNPWEQSGDRFIVRSDEKVYVDESFEDGWEKLEVEAQKIELAEGDVLYFYALTDGGWLSLYLDVTIAPTEADADNEGVDYVAPDADPEAKDAEDAEEADEAEDAEVASPWNNVDNFTDTVRAPWAYEITTDQGETFEAMDTYKEVEWGLFFYPSDESYTGAGLNNDAEGYMELNSADNNSEISVLVFVAPEDGNYKINAFEMPNLWGQDGKVFRIQVEDEVIFEGKIENPEFEQYAFDLEVPEMVVELEEGQVVRFYSTTIGNWYSTYVNVTIETTDDEVNLPELPEE